MVWSYMLKPPRRFHLRGGTALCGRGNTRTGTLLKGRRVEDMHSSDAVTLCAQERDAQLIRDSQFAMYESPWRRNGILLCH